MFISFPARRVVKSSEETSIKLTIGFDVLSFDGLSDELAPPDEPPHPIIVNKNNINTNKLFIYFFIRQFLPLSFSCVIL